LISFVCNSQLVLYPGPNVQNNEPHAFNAGPFMINRAIEVFDPAVQQANTPAASATNRGYWGKRNRAADVLYEPTINAAPIAKDGNGAMGSSNLAASSTNTASPPPSNRYYGYYGLSGYGYGYPDMYGSYGKRSNSNGGRKFNSAADENNEPHAFNAGPFMINRAIEIFDPAVQQTNAPPAASATNRGFWGKRNRAAEPTINAAPIAKDGNRAMGPSNPAAGTNTAPPPPSNRYYGYNGWYGYGYAYPDMYGSYGKRSNSNGGRKFNSAADDVPKINAALMVTNGNRAVEFLYPAASTNTAAPPPSNRYYA
jgi:hypothetical protein